MTPQAWAAQHCPKEKARRRPFPSFMKKTRPKLS
jgi:hypothetical protein